MTDAEAYTEYVRRQNGSSNPDAVTITSDRDPKNWRIIPNEAERRPCCEGHVNMFAHLRSANHIAHLYGLDPRAFVGYVRTRRHLETWSARRVAR
jgi:hypothetical protein